MKSYSIILGVLISLLASNSAHAQLLNFDFTIIGDPTINDPSTTYFAGTVTGELIGLQNNASSAPSDVVIFSAPAALNVPLGVPYSLKDHGWNLSYLSSFTVNNGVITSALNYTNALPNPPDEFYLNVSINDQTPNVGELNGIDFDNKAVANLGGFSGVTYTAAPEPASWTMGMIALTMLVIGVCARTRNGLFLLTPASAACRDTSSRTF